MIPLDQSIESAKQLAQKAFDGVTRRDGSPYFLHCERVAQIAGEIAKRVYANRPPREIEAYKNIFVSAAYLHDVKEDTNYSIDDFDHSIQVIVDNVTKKEGENYFDFIMRIMTGGHYNTWIVKLADLTDNLSDLNEGSMKDKYRFAKHIIESKLYTT